jgi:plastocyanin
MSSRPRSLILLIALPVVVLLSIATIGVASARQSHPDHVKSALATRTITIHSFTFTVPRSVLHGTRVRVVNQDSVTHTVTSNRAGKFNVLVPGNSTRSFIAPATPRKYGFHCNIHPTMTGVLKVR